MDACNRFESRGTYLVMRLEYLAALAACVALAVAHVEVIRWWHFIAFFAYIDLIGYVPGAIAYRRHRDGEIPRIYFVLYNTMHSFLFNGAAIALYCLAFGPEWSLLAIPIHLLGDRALFGNTLKPWGVSFEPRTHPAFARFEREFGDPTARQE